MNTRKHNMLTDKRVVITGAATGIGKATAIYFASLGATLVLGDNNTDGGNKTVEYIRELGGTASFFPLNVAEETSVRKFTLSACANKLTSIPHGGGPRSTHNAR